MYYGVYNRLHHNNKSGRKATYRCGYNPVETYRVSGSRDTWESTIIGMHANASVRDKFSVSTNSGGNGELEYPVALMTADEVAYAGGMYRVRSPYTYYFLNSTCESVTGGNKWWTMSPCDYYWTFASMISVYGDEMNSYYVNNSTNGTRPVLSLKSCVKYSSGNGTSSSPYQVSIDSTCASAVN